MVFTMITPDTSVMFFATQINLYFQGPKNYTSAGA
jgi:hypothetical protein